jgi:hypothetical protein
LESRIVPSMRAMSTWNMAMSDVRSPYTLARVRSFLTSLKLGMWPQSGFASVTPTRLWPAKPYGICARSMSSPLLIPPCGSFHPWTRIGGYGGLVWIPCRVGTCKRTTQPWCIWPRESPMFGVGN